MNDKDPVKPVLTFVAPFLLVFIAVLQLFFSHQQNLSQWKGGGFGMFSSIDRPNARIFQSYFITGNQAIPFDIPNTEFFTRLHSIAYTFPTNSNINALLAGLNQLDWFCMDQDKQTTETDDWVYCFSEIEMEQYNREFGEGSYELSLFRQIHPDAIRIEVWRKKYHSNARLLEKELINRRDIIGQPKSAGP